MSISIKVYLIFLISFLLTGCGDSTSAPSTPDPITPTDVTAISSKGNVVINWTSKTSEKYDLYISTEESIEFNNYASYDNSEWIKDIYPPYSFKPTDYSQVYFFAVVAKTEQQESEQSAIVSAIPRYLDNGSTITDLNTMLTWDRCSVGQTWDDAKKACVGEVTRMSHDQATKYATSQGNEWRLPELSELTTLVFCKDGKPNYFLPTEDYSCQNPNNDNPTVYDAIFPNVAIHTNYISNTRYIAPSSTAIFYHSVSFLKGGKSGVFGSEPTWQAVRLVKTHTPPNQTKL
ncbi:DUF1566 domain-containing protein [Shewanella sp. 10N.286.51.B8]|uniref:Lcl C-terminal domain-containing protein n=1 Tax=Shewanella sp. 10N.286.51.B8 TaxID=3229708 RepID=UPI00354C5BF1